MGIGIWQLLVILVIVILLFGTKRLKNIGTDLGGALKGFKSAVKEEEDKPKTKESIEQKAEGDIIEGEVEQKEKTK